MRRIKYDIAPEIFRDFPGYRLGVVVFDGLDNSGSHPTLEAKLREAEASARERVRGNVVDHERVAPWREAYRKFGAKPGDHRSSIESLLRRAIKADHLPTINPLVDIGNIVSLETLMPAGVHPIRHEVTHFSVRQACTGDQFVATDAGLAEAVLPGEVVLADQNEVLTRRWTWRQSINTRTLSNSSSVLFNVDGLPPANATEIEIAIERIKDLVRMHCGGAVVHSEILSEDNSSFEVHMASR